MKAKDRLGQSKEGASRVKIIALKICFLVHILNQVAIYNDTGIIRCYTVECNYNMGRFAVFIFTS